MVPKPKILCLTLLPASNSEAFDLEGDVESVDDVLPPPIADEGFS